MIATLRDFGESKLGTTRLCPTPGSLSQQYRSPFAIAPSQASFAIRDFRRGNAQSRHRLEEIGKTFLFGLNCSLVADNVETLQGVIQTLDHDRRGFAVEGAARGAAVADALMPVRVVEAWQ
jgi:hypothetical protein